jgi:putative PIN family toxin of toxin-antitoxin system
MRIVLDCNVVIAAARTDGLCRRAVLAAIRWCEVVVSAEILAEYREVAGRPKHAESAAVAEVLIDEIEQIAILVAPAGVQTLPDPDDGVYLAAAVEGQAGVLVTGNRRHFPAELCGEVEVLEPRAFLERFV